MTHAGVGLLSLTLRWMPWPGAVICCLGGIALNFWIMPFLAPKIFRPGENRFSGIRAYPMAVLLLVLCFPLRTAAAAWAVLALGDAMAALVGRAYGSAKLPWNREKSLQGLIAFVCFGTCAGALSYSFVESRSNRAFGWFGEIYSYFGQRPWLDTLNGHYSFWANPAFPSGRAADYTESFATGAGDLRVWTAALAASLVAGVAETIYVKIDDNFRTAIAAGVVFLYLDPLTAAINAAF
jgi:hypothetical protein